MIYDRFDIWKIDPDGQRLPLNITHGFGARHNIKLKYFREFNADVPVSLSDQDTMMLYGLNLSTKYNDFFGLVPSGKGTLIKKRIYRPFFLFPVY